MSWEHSVAVLAGHLSGSLFGPIVGPELSVHSPVSRSLGKIGPAKGFALVIIPGSVPS